MSSSVIVYICIISHILIPLTHSGRSEKVCADSAQCENGKIATNAVTCSGYQGCLSASIVSKGIGPGAFIACTGSHGCAEATEISAKKNVLCQAYKSCYGSSTITADNSLQCSGSQSCSDCDNAVAKDVLCGGFEACAKCPITADSIQCNGLSSCSKTSLTTSETCTECTINCEGNKSCLRVKLSSTNTIECSGNVACKGATIKSGTAIMSGFGAGMDARLHETAVVIGEGYNSLEGAEIMSGSVNKTKTTTTSSGSTSAPSGGSSSTTNTTMTVILSSTSGKDATIIAQSGDEVIVECEDDCSQTEVLAFSNSTLSVTSGGITCDENSGSSTGCPTIMISSEECEDVHLYKYLQKRTMDRFLKYDMYSEEDGDSHKRPISDSTANDFLHDMYEIDHYVTKKCHKEQDCMKQDFDDKDAQCYGSEACSESNIDQTSAGTYCYGYRSCFKATFVSKQGAIECDGLESCAFATSVEGKEVYCRANSACVGEENRKLEQKTPFITGSLNCEGSFSCAENYIQNTGQRSVMCVANRACFNTFIVSANNIICDGSYSCAESVLRTVAAVKCTGKLSCSGSVLNATKYVYADGDNAAAGATIYSAGVRGYGYRSLQNAFIDSSDLGKVTLKLYGNETGKGATLRCRKGDECMLKCEGTGCKGLNYECEVGADCNASPTLCINIREARGKNPKEIGGVQCPTFSIIEVSLDVGNNMEYEMVQMRNVKREHRWKISHRFFNYLVTFVVFVIGVVLYLVYYYYKTVICNKQKGYDYEYLV